MTRRARREYYVYSVAGREHAIESVDAEMRLRVHLREPSSWKVFTPHRFDIVVRVQRTELIDAVERFMKVLECRREQLRFRYRVKAVGLPDGPSSSSGGHGYGCMFKGELATVDAGPGYCQIVAAEPGTIGPPRVLADMTDMQERVSDSGVRYIPSRREEPILLLEKMQGLLEFLTQQEGDVVEQRIERR